MATTPLDELRQQVARGQVLLVAGAGLAKGLSGGAKPTLWTELLEHGIEYCEAFAMGLPEGWGERQRDQLRKGDIRDMLGVAQNVSDRLGAPDGGEFSAWLRSAFESLEVKDLKLARAVTGLGLPIATTNYDHLIEKATGLGTVTWRERSDVQRVIRSDQEAVLHLHGQYRDPRSVILGTGSYQRIEDDEHAQEVLRALQLIQSLLFVGFGDGLGDPNFSAMLRHVVRVHSGSTYHHYRLVRRQELKAVSATHARDERILVISYGETFDDLPLFLNSLGQRTQTLRCNATPAREGSASGFASQTAGSTVSPELPTRPYRGLRPFFEEHAVFFHGRHTLAQRLRSKLAGRAVVAVVGASGCGKSSLVRAGLVPMLRAGRSDWHILTMYPSDRPLHALAGVFLAAIRPDMTEAEHIRQVRELASAMRETSFELRDLLGRLSSVHSVAEHVLLVVDQWEEIYTQCTDEQARHRFIDLLLSGARPGQARVVLTLRGDFFGHVIEHRALSEQLQDGIVHVGPMSREELQEAVEAPAETLGVRFEPGLVARILDDIQSAPGQLPLLEFVLDALWDLRTEGHMTHAAYESAGRIHGAVARRAEELLESLGEKEIAAVRRLFTLLVHVGEMGDSTRRRARASELPADTRHLAQTFVDARLLVRGYDPTAAESTVEIAHEAMIRNWSGLRAWIEEDKEYLQWRGRLGQSIQEWMLHSRADGFLLYGARLAEAERWLHDRAEDISPEEREYIALSHDNLTTVESITQQLEEARRTAEAASWAKDQFLGVLSHELRTPLTPVLVAAHAMEEDAQLPPEWRDSAAMIRRNVELEARLLDDLLDLNRTVRGKLELIREQLDAHELLRNAIDACRADLAAKTLVVDIDLSATRAVVSGDASRLRQVFWNILKNAAKFTPAAGKVCVSTRNRTEGQLEVAISDSGIGIAPEILPKVFTAFEQGDAGVRKFGGLGLGLAVSKALVQMHGGEIHAVSGGRGRGTTIVIILPTVAGPPVPSKVVSSLTLDGGHKPRVLLVEDHRDTRAVLSRLLRNHGCELDAVGTVSEAKAQIDAKPFDCVLADTGLPDGSGLDVLTYLRLKQPTVKSIAMSAYAMERDIRHLQKAEFDSWLVKPVSVRTLLQVVAACVEKPNRSEDGT